MKIELKQLTFGWRQHPLFERIDAFLPGGEMVLLRGENGSGKTTLLKLMAGMIPHFSRGRCLSGDILLNGGSLVRQPPKSFFPLIAWVPSRHLDFYLLNTTLSEEILLIKTVLSGETEAVEQRRIHFQSLFPEIGALMNVPVQDLQARQKMLCLLAVYFLQGAGLWLLDEPFRFLQESDIPRLERFFGLLQKKNGIIVASTHRGFESDRPVWQLQGGRLIRD